jgi:hypothetical protein
MGVGDGDGSGFFPDTYSKKAIVGIVFEGLTLKDIENLSQKLNVEGASYEIKKQHQFLRKPLVKLLYNPDKEIKQDEFNKKLGVVIENIAAQLKKDFKYYFVHWDPKYHVSGISSMNKAIYNDNEVTFSPTIG